jgi:transposase
MKNRGASLGIKDCTLKFLPLRGNKSPAPPVIVVLLYNAEIYAILRGMAYDKVFRKRVIEYKDAGHTFKEVEEAFGVDSKRYYSWKKQLEQTGSLESKKPKERCGKINKEELLRLLKEHPDWYLREFAEKLNVCLQSIDKMLKKIGVTRKKKRLLILKNRKKTEKNI